ncbi:MAG TPA: methyltransferase domain-containing protein [Bryobacteraceae bacterium]|jgi:ubiquinone/menaquinone biosynthesis C-methylase UbiE
MPPLLVSPIEGHRIWSASYDDDPNPLLALGMRVLSERLGPVHGLRVIDVACGTGRWMSAALSDGANTIGIDLCDEMLAAAARKPALKGCLALAQADQLPFANGGADLVLCSFAMSYFPSASGAIAEMARVTRRGGRVVVADLHPGANEAGWKRAFRSNDSVYEIEHHSHSVAYLEAAAEQAALEQVWQTDAHFGAPEREIFQKAGKDSVFAQASSIPALSVICWKKL